MDDELQRKKIAQLKQLNTQNVFLKGFKHLKSHSEAPKTPRSNTATLPTTIL
ncbi:hypothetical protein Scep_001899 [Stephania cephalantha]|uniref:Uncharacterized protein n=1 Tax=Stephania cephalantha TaxID=152367 RepID=A0AAP0L918_9MAGN